MDSIEVATRAIAHYEACAAAWDAEARRFVRDQVTATNAADRRDAERRLENAVEHVTTNRRIAAELRSAFGIEA